MSNDIDAAAALCVCILAWALDWVAISENLIGFFWS